MSYYLVLKDNIPVEATLNRDRAHELAKQWAHKWGVVEVVEVVRRAEVPGEWVQLELPLGHDCMDSGCPEPCHTLINYYRPPPGHPGHNCSDIRCRDEHPRGRCLNNHEVGE